MAKNRDLTFIGGGSADAVWCAAKGSTFPTGFAAPGIAFTEVGYLSDDGIEYNGNVDRKEFKAHQGGTVIRRKVTGNGREWKFTALEYNPVTSLLLDPGIVWVKTGTGGTAYATGTIPEVVTTIEMAWIVDVYDGVVLRRHMFTGEATNTGAFKYGVEDMTAFEFTLAAYGSPLIVTNDADLLTVLP